MKKIYIYIICSILSSVLYAQEGFGTYLRDVIQKQEKGILVTAKLIEACGLCDSLDIILDEEYERLYQSGQIPTSIQTGYYTFYAPEHRKYGFTLFAETDDFWEGVLGKDYKAVTVADVTGYIQQHCQFTKDYRKDGDYSNSANVLYQFVTYHLLNRRLMPNTLVNHYNEIGYSIATKQPTVPICEYYTTMGDRRLLRTYESAESDGVCLNRFPVLDDGRKGTYHELSCEPDKAGIHVDIKNTMWPSNAIIYPISSLLAYDQTTAQNMGRIRLRMDIASFFPEMATNDIRLKAIRLDRYNNVWLPNNIYPYLDDLTINDNSSNFCYFTGYGYSWSNMQGDEFNCSGNQDFSLRLPPVPSRGTYELRIAIQSASSARGIYQIYFGTDRDRLVPMGMPKDFRQGGTVIRTKTGSIPSYIGYERDTGDDYYDQMRDNELHEAGFMKGCNQYCNGYGYETTMRSYEYNLRCIIGRMTMDPEQTYYLRLKSILDDATTELYLDYIELCPKEVYDNPYKPEDIW